MKTGVGLCLVILALGLCITQWNVHQLHERARNQSQWLSNVESVAVRADRRKPVDTSGSIKAMQREYDQVVAELARRTEDLCFALAIVAGEVAHRERLPAGVGDWCNLPPRTGQARVWRKRGWNVTDEEAAAIRARINQGQRGTIKQPDLCGWPPVRCGGVK